MGACRTIDPARQARRQQAPCRGARSDERDHVYFEHGMPVACDPERSAAAQQTLWESLSLPSCALEVLIHAWWHGFVVLISNVFAYHLRIQEAVTANEAIPLVAGEDVRTPLRAFRVVFGIGHFNASTTLPQRRRAA